MSEADLLIGQCKLLDALSRGRRNFADRGARLLGNNENEADILLLRGGFACASLVLTNGRRAIRDILIPGDIIGLDHILVRPIDEFTAASRLEYSSLPSSEVRRLMADYAAALAICGYLVEARWRASRLAMAIGRLDAQARLCLFLADIYDRLRHRDLINRPTFALPLTQEQIADHLGLTIVHVNRTLRRLREEEVVIMDRQTVVIPDVDRLRAVAEEAGLPALF